MTRATIVNMLDRKAAQADRLYGQRAQFIRRKEGTLNIETGEQQDTVTTKAIWVRSWPLSLRERLDLTASGITEVEARWTLRAAYQDTVEPGDIIKIGSLVYEVVARGVSTDEHGVEHTILTRRRR